MTLNQTDTEFGISSTTVRCFRHLFDDQCDGRHGVWLMTESRRGVFYHGDREESQTPRYTLDELSEWSEMQGEGFLDVQEIPPEVALAELASWPAAHDEAMGIFLRHAFIGKEDD